MRSTRRMKITVEKERLLVVSQQPGIDCWCDACSTTVRMLRPREAAAVADVSDRTIFRQIESGQLHFSETPEGVLFICLNSLINRKRMGSADE